MLASNDPPPVQKFKFKVTTKLQTKLQRKLTQSLISCPAMILKSWQTSPKKSKLTLVPVHLQPYHLMSHVQSLLKITNNLEITYLSLFSSHTSLP